MRAYDAYACQFEEKFTQKLEQFALADVDRFSNELKGPKVLDVGCGPGAYLGMFRDKGLDALGIDLSDSFLERCQSQGFNVRKMDVESPLLYPYSFDGVWATAVVPHIPRSRLALTLQNWSKLLKPTGVLWLSSRLWEGTNEGMQEDDRYPGHERWITRYTEAELRAAVEKRFTILNAEIDQPEMGRTYFKILARVKPETKSAMRNF